MKKETEEERVERIENGPSSTIFSIDERINREKKATEYIFQPFGLDRIDPISIAPPAGTVVVKTQPFGCPRNGTMGYSYVKDAQTGEFYGLVKQASLVLVNKKAQSEEA